MDSRTPPPESLLDLIPCGLLSFESGGPVCYYNRAFQDYTGYTADEMVGQSIEKLLTLPSKVFFQTHLLPLLRLQNTVQEVYLNFRSKAGKSLPMLLNARQVVEGRQSLIHCSCFPLNHRSRYEEQLLQEKRAAERRAQSGNQEALQQLEEQKEETDRYVRELKDLNHELLQFQKLLSHDMTEQVRKIHLFTDLLFKHSGQGFSPQQRRYQAAIHTALFKMRRLFGYLSQFIGLTEKQEKPVALDLQALIRKAFTHIEHLYPDANATLDLGEIPPIEAIPVQMESLFLQLLDNSFKFQQAQQAPHISIATCILPYNSLEGITGKYRYQNYLQILYTDNSRGFDQKYIEEAFMMLNRISEESTGGMGLSFCRKIVNNHHGFIQIDPGFNEGVRVKIYLPA